MSSINNTSFVYLIGDSTLYNNDSLQDDLVLNADQGCIEKTLKTQLGNSYTVINYAFPGCTTDHVLRKVYERKRDDGKDIYSLPLETEIQKHSDAKHYVVVSVGGNDFRNPLLLSPWNFLHKISTVQSNYLQILGQVQAIQGRNVVPILMFQYRTNFQDDGYKIYATFKRFGLVMAKLNICAMGLIGYAAYSWCAGKVSRTVGLGGVFLGGVFLYLSHRQLSIRFMVDMVTEDTGLVVFQTLLNRFYAPIIARAGRDQIPIIQSNETLDPNRSEHYINSIEPSEEGGKVIAQKIAEVIRSNLTKG